ncbi:Tripartite motif-containing protein 5 [Bienertia sinuspersici]
MSPNQVNELFEFPLEGTIGPDSFKYFCEGVGDKGFVAKHFWKEVTGRSEWVVGFTKSFAFVNPVIRLSHRLLLQVFYPKGETGQVATNDFQMLWWFVHGDPATMGQLDFGRFLIAAFIWERDHTRDPSPWVVLSLFLPNISELHYPLLLRWLDMPCLTLGKWRTIVNGWCTVVTRIMNGLLRVKEKMLKKFCMLIFLVLQPV